VFLQKAALAAASVARLGEAVEINVQLMPSFLSASRAVVFLTDMAEERCVPIALGFSGKRR
jgi:hypothetical protein